MKAALLAHRYFSGQPTGIGRYVRSVVTAFASQGTLDLVAASPAEPRNDDWLPPNVEYRALPGHRRVTQAALRLGLRLPIDRWLGEPDVVHALQPFMPLPTKKAAVMTIHDILPVSHPEWFGRVQRLAFKRMLHQLERDQTHIVCVSRYVADELVSHTQGRIDAERVTAVHSGVDDQFRQPLGAHAVAEVCRTYGLEMGRYLLGLGVMSARESPDVVLEALRDVDPALLGSPALVLTGPTRFGAERVLSAVDRYGLADRVLLAGFVPDDDLIPLIAGAMALTHPARDEGFGLTTLEAMAVGTPVIASRAGSLPEIVGDGGVLVSPQDPAAWAEAIAEVAGDPEVRARLVERGSTRQARFSWDRTAVETAAVYVRAAAG